MNKLIKEQQLYISKNVINAGYMMLILIIFVMIFYLFIALPIRSPRELGIVILVELLLLLIIIIIHSIIQRENPKYPFQLYENGFIYPIKIKGADETTNYIDFSQIEKMAFTLYGLQLSIKIKNNGIANITPRWASESYFILCKMICKRFEQYPCPDLDLLEKAFHLNQENQNVDSIMKQVKEKNKDFRNLPEKFG